MVFSRCCVSFEDDFVRQTTADWKQMFLRIDCVNFGFHFFFNFQASTSAFKVFTGLKLHYQDNGIAANFRFADDIVENAEEEEEADILLGRLDRITRRYTIEIIHNKTKVMTSNSKGFQRDIKITGRRLEAVKNFIYLGAIISNEGSNQNCPDNSISF